MKSIHIRNIDEKVLQSLKALAKMHHRSLQGELHHLLTEAAKKSPSNEMYEELQIITVNTGVTKPWNREDIYGNEGR